MQIRCKKVAGTKINKCLVGYPTETPSVDKVDTITLIQEDPIIKK